VERNYRQFLYKCSVCTHKLIAKIRIPSSTFSPSPPLPQKLSRELLREEDTSFHYRIVRLQKLSSMRLFRSAKGASGPPPDHEQGMWWICLGNRVDYRLPRQIVWVEKTYGGKSRGCKSTPAGLFLENWNLGGIHKWLGGGGVSWGANYKFALKTLKH